MYGKNYTSNFAKTICNLEQREYGRKKWSKKTWRAQHAATSKLYIMEAKPNRGINLGGKVRVSPKSRFSKSFIRKRNLWWGYCLARSPRTPTTRQARAGLHLPPATARRTAAAAGITQAVTRAAFHFATAGAINSGRLRRSRGRALKLAHAAPE